MDYFKNDADDEAEDDEVEVGENSRKNKEKQRHITPGQRRSQRRNMYRTRLALQHLTNTSNHNLFIARNGNRLTRLFTSTGGGRRNFSQSLRRLGYEQTINNLKLKADAKVLCQGFTGKTVRSTSSHPANVLPSSLGPDAGNADVYRRRFTSHKHSSMAQIWSAVSPLRKPVRPTLVCPSLAVCARLASPSFARMVRSS